MFHFFLFLFANIILQPRSLLFLSLISWFLILEAIYNGKFLFCFFVIHFFYFDLLMSFPSISVTNFVYTFFFLGCSWFWRLFIMVCFFLFLCYCYSFFYSFFSFWFANFVLHPHFLFLSLISFTHSFFQVVLGSEGYL